MIQKSFENITPKSHLYTFRHVQERQKFNSGSKFGFGMWEKLFLRKCSWNNLLKYSSDFYQLKYILDSAYSADSRAFHVSVDHLNSMISICWH